MTKHVINRTEMKYVMVLMIFYFTFQAIKCERLHEQIYSSIEGGAACFRILNGTHQAGCSSGNNGAVGVVHMVKDLSDAQWMIVNGTDAPYIPVINTIIFNDVVELFMSNPHIIAGMLIYHNATLKTTAFSPESRCPNEYSAGPGSQCSSSQAGGYVWNEKGTSLLRRDIPFPIFYLPQTRMEEIIKIQQCYEKYNLDKSNQKGRPLCSVQLSSFMYAAVNTVVCQRRSATTALLTPTKVCDPLGDFNVYMPLFPLSEEKGTKNKSVIFVTARMDSASLFDGIAPGAASTVVGMVTLIAAAKTLRDLIPEKDANLYDVNVLWTLLNGEAFDYIGSQRVAYDIERGTWPPARPLAPSDLSLHLEIGQLGGALRSGTNFTWPLYTFAPYEVPPPQITEFLFEMTKHMAKTNSSIIPMFNTNLPPSSLHSFRKILKNVTETGQLAELLLTDFSNTFNNMFYHSALDDADNIGFSYHNISIDSRGTFISTEELLINGTMKEEDPQIKVARLATALAHTLYHQVVGQSYTGNITASAHLVDELLYCYLESQACKLLMAADYAPQDDPDEPPAQTPVPLYVGVATWNTSAAVFSGHLLALLVGSSVTANRTGCSKLGAIHPEYSYYWLNGWDYSGVCIQTTMNFSQALSPAFTTPNYDFSSGMYSSWTESVWASMWARVFVAASGAGARAAAVAGALATALAAFLTYWLHAHADSVFTAPAALPSDAAAGILRTVNC